MKKEAIAYHEAGHVAASLYYQHPFEFVSLNSKELLSGK